MSRSINIGKNGSNKNGSNKNGSNKNGYKNGSNKNGSNKNGSNKGSAGEQAKRALEMTGKERVNGKTISKKKEKTSYKLMSALGKLEQKGLANFSTIDQNAATVLDIDPLTANALQILGAFGITIDMSLDESLDLKQDVTDTETINNPNIEDKNMKNMKNKKKNAKDKFPSTEDSFYKLGKKQRSRKQSHSSELAQDLPELAIQLMAAAVGGTLS